MFELVVDRADDDEVDDVFELMDDVVCKLPGDK